MKKAILLKNNVLVRGIGINDADYAVCETINGKKTMCHYYSVWVDMFTRCYSDKYHKKKPTYIGCTVAEEWHKFSNFKKWMEKQDWQGKQLDKDVLCVGNKIYSSENCVFVSALVNSMLTHVRTTKGEYPVGVNYNDSCNNKFMARCHIDGKRKHLGRFATPEEAGKAYKTAKSNEINRIALQQGDERIKNGLIKHAEHLLNE